MPPSRNDIRNTSRRTITVYQCPTCDTRYLGQQWCHDCHTPCTRLDLGGLCPHCDEPVAISDIIEQPRKPTGDTGTKAPEAHSIYETGISALIAL
jgi:hypothetical protein